MTYDGFGPLGMAPENSACLATLAALVAFAEPEFGAPDCP